MQVRESVRDWLPRSRTSRHGHLAQQYGEIVQVRPIRQIHNQRTESDAFENEVPVRQSTRARHISEGSAFFVCDPDGGEGPFIAQTATAGFQKEKRKERNIFGGGTAI